MREIYGSNVQRTDKDNLNWNQFRLGLAMFGGRNVNFKTKIFNSKVGKMKNSRSVL